MSATACLDSVNRNKILAAVVASLILHLLAILSVGVAVSWQPTPRPLANDEPPELILVAPPVPSQPGYVQTSETQRADKAPERPAFESDKDTRAASENAPTGTEALPSQDGRDNPALQFENQNHSLGKQARPSAPAASSPASPPSEPSSKAVPTPRPQAELALLEPPKAATEPRPKPRESTEEPARTEKPKTQAQNPLPPGYQPETRVTRIRGNISNRGRSAVDAAATPLGRYKKMLSDAIGSRWYYYVNEQMGLLNVGTVDIRFIVRPNGRVEGVRVLHNSSNESFASTSVRAIMEAEIPPIPEDVARLLQNGRIEIDYSFTIMSH